ncbi:MAG: class I SAM-dependent methyltransferase [Candidatus Eiseniibacteriota bacterium]
MEEVWGQRVTRAWADQFPIAPYRKLLLREQNPKGTRALEVGSGPAHDSLYLAEHGFQVWGVDWSLPGLQAGRQLYADEKQELVAVRSDIRALPFRDGSFDFVWNAGVLEHFHDPDVLQILSEMKRVARVGGTVMAVVPNRFYFWYQAHLAGKRLFGRGHQYGFERAFDAGYLSRQFRSAGFGDVRMTGIHLHPAPSFLIPKTGFLTKLFARLCGPLEAAGRHSPARAYLGLDLVVWARKDGRAERPT